MSRILRRQKPARSGHSPTKYKPLRDPQDPSSSGWGLCPQTPAPAAAFELTAEMIVPCYSIQEIQPATLNSNQYTDSGAKPGSISTNVPRTRVGAAGYRIELLEPRIRSSTLPAQQSDDPTKMIEPATATSTPNQGPNLVRDLSKSGWGRGLSKPPPFCSRHAPRSSILQPQHDICIVRRNFCITHFVQPLYRRSDSVLVPR